MAHKCKRRLRRWDRDREGVGDGLGWGWRQGWPELGSPSWLSTSTWALQGPEPKFRWGNAGPCPVQVQLTVATGVWGVKRLQRQRCEQGARQPAEPRAGPAAGLTPGGEMSCWDGAEGKVSAPVMKVAGCLGVPVGAQHHPWLHRTSEG